MTNSFFQTQFFATPLRSWLSFSTLPQGLDFLLCSHNNSGTVLGQSLSFLLDRICQWINSFWYIFICAHRHMISNNLYWVTETEHEFLLRYPEISLRETNERTWAVYAQGSALPWLAGKSGAFFLLVFALNFINSTAISGCTSSLFSKSGPFPQRFWSF